jgi:hypothetical protein
MGWRSLSNGELMREAAPFFDLFVTLDQNLQFQNPTGNYPLGIVVLVTRFNDLGAYRARFTHIRDAVLRTKRGQITIFQVQ